MPMRCQLRILMAQRRIGSVSEVVRLTGVNRKAVQKLYNEQDLDTVKMATIKTMCDAFQCRLSDFIEYDPKG